MSETKLNLSDAQLTISGTTHASVADACIASLSAEPETITELEAALARYQKPSGDISPFGWFRKGNIDNERGTPGSSSSISRRGSSPLSRLTLDQDQKVK